MKTAVKAGLVLAGIVTVLSLLIAVAGLNRSMPFVATMGAIMLFAVINVVIVWWSLSKTAGENGYGKQVLSGLLLGLVGGVTIFITSYVMTEFLFPSYLAELSDAVLDAMAAGGATQEQLDGQAEALARSSSFTQALGGTFGTLATSILASLIIASFKRKK